MESDISTRVDERIGGQGSHGRSAASWGAIFAGAVVAAAVSLLLLSLGAGLGFSFVSPWEGSGVTATTFAATTAMWFIVIQWVAAGFGGYLAGRLRTRWIGTHSHEVFFRDTAHGLVTWALATVIAASVLTGAVSSLVGGGVRQASAIAAQAVDLPAASSISSSASYNVDKMFRGPSNSNSAGADKRAEAAHILAHAAPATPVSSDDRNYLAALIAQNTGVSDEDARQRVDVAIAGEMDARVKAKEAVDGARKAAAEAAIFTALAMLVGALIASASAVLGGRIRDNHL